ncbi:hypothetical protein MMC12_006401 [Toensbergia leucococca]|nr:hypothetical protein [Toensbergia leucococca]
MAVVPLGVIAAPKHKTWTVEEQTKCKEIWKEKAYFVKHSNNPLAFTQLDNSDGCPLPKRFDHFEKALETRHHHDEHHNEHDTKHDKKHDKKCKYQWAKMDNWHANLYARPKITEDCLRWHDDMCERQWKEQPFLGFSIPPRVSKDCQRYIDAKGHLHELPNLGGQNLKRDTNLAANILPLTLPNASPDNTAVDLQTLVYAETAAAAKNAEKGKPEVVDPLCPNGGTYDFDMSLTDGCTGDKECNDPCYNRFGG